MSHAHSKNIYANLDVEEDCGGQSHEQLERKALKKLREIENLKKKPNPTVEEQEKMKTEKYWKNLVHPQQHKQTAKEIKKRAEKEKKRKREQDKKEEDQRRKKAEQDKKEEDQRRKEEEQYKKEEEQRRKKAEQENTNQKREQDRDIVLGSLYMNTPEAITIYNEYIEILNSENSKIAFRRLCLKYHPDKNPTKNTTHCQQILQHIHEKKSRV